MDNVKENRHGKVHAKELRHKKKYQDTAPAPRKAIAPQPQPQQQLEEDHPGSNTTSSGDNFKELASRTTTGGSLVLKSEREWNKDITLGGSDQFTHYFDLNVQQLADAISTIPFHERFNLEDVQLPPEIIARFCQEAGCSVDSRTTLPSNTKILTPRESNIPEELETKKADPPQLPLTLEDPPADEIVAELDPKEDIQGWLDDVLDL